MSSGLKQKPYLINDRLNYAPAIKTVLKDPLKEREVVTELIIDTGFQGGVLIPIETYVSLNLNLYEELKTLARTAVGKTVELRTSKAYVEVGGREVLCSAYTALNVEKPLLGREVLSKVGLLYSPPNKIGFLNKTQ